MNTVNIELKYKLHNTNCINFTADLGKKLKKILNIAFHSTAVNYCRCILLKYFWNLYIFLKIKLENKFLHLVMLSQMFVYKHILNSYCLGFLFFFFFFYWFLFCFLFCFIALFGYYNIDVRHSHACVVVMNLHSLL